MQAADIGCDRCYDPAGRQAGLFLEGCCIGIHLPGIVEHGPDLVFEAIGSSVPELAILKSAIEQGGGVPVKVLMAVEGNAERQAVGEHFFGVMAGGAAFPAVAGEGGIGEEPLAEEGLG